MLTSNCGEYQDDIKRSEEEDSSSALASHISKGVPFTKASMIRNLSLRPIIFCRINLQPVNERSECVHIVVYLLGSLAM